MAGYLGTRAVLLSTTAADVVGNAEIGGSLTVSGAFTSQGIDDNASATAMTLDASGNVGIGTSSPATKMEVLSGGTFDSAIRIGDTGSSRRLILEQTDVVNYSIGGTGTNCSTIFVSGGTSGIGNEAARIDSSGNLLVGKTSADFGATAGMAMQSNDTLYVARDGGSPFVANRKTSDGDIAVFRKNDSTVGSIGTHDSRLAIGSDDTYIMFDSGSSPAIWPSNGSAALDNTIDIGDPTYRFDDIYATNGTIQTSDRNEKQDIEVLSDAEQRVAVACKGLLRKFRWKDAVAEKGDDARIHFGIIAQDLQDAFAAEGLDAGRYAMFISSTWWETQTDVPAVEAVEAVYEDVVIPAVLDEDGNEVEAERTEQQLVTEAVEAKEAYTRTDTYETLEEAPEGATERTRLGVRYPELLAFIIGAM